MKYLQSFESLATARKYKDELEDKFDYGVFGILKSLDPTTNYKYLHMICKYALDDIDFDDIKEYIKKFNMLCDINKIEEKNIDKYKDFNSLKNIVDATKTETKGDIHREIKKEREIIIDNDDILIFVPLSYRSSVKYGHDTTWCISARDNNDMWYFTNSNNTLLYFIIIKNKNIIQKLHHNLKNDIITQDDLISVDDDIAYDVDNFSKWCVVIHPQNVFGSIWSKYNCELRKHKKNTFFDIIGIDEHIFKNNNPISNRTIGDLLEKIK